MIKERKQNKFLLEGDDGDFSIELPLNQDLIKKIAIDFDDEGDCVMSNGTDTDIDQFDDISDEGINEFFKTYWNQIFNNGEIEYENNQIGEYGYGMDNYAVAHNADMTFNGLDYNWKEHG
jgi:hypothetical protein